MILIGAIFENLEFLPPFGGGEGGEGDPNFERIVRLILTANVFARWLIDEEQQAYLKAKEVKEAKERMVSTSQTESSPASD